MKSYSSKEEAYAALIFFLSNPTQWTQKRWRLIESNVRSQARSKSENAAKRRALHRKPRPHTYKKRIKDVTV